jgi:hypothetical protein
MKDITPQAMEVTEENISALAKSFLAEEEYDTELIIETAGQHILQSNSKRGHMQLKTKLAIDSIIDEKQHTNRHRVKDATSHNTNRFAHSEVSCISNQKICIIH